MTLYRVSFDLPITVDVEADSAQEAGNKVRKMAWTPTFHASVSTYSIGFTELRVAEVQEAARQEEQE